MTAIDGNTRTPMEMRAAPRFSLMLRAAKLLGQSGEYVCVVRDVSETGVKLKLFHEAPPEDYFLLELGNGERYPMELVWAAEGHAGFRFVRGIDVTRFIAEPADHPRRSLRLRISCPSEVHSGGIDMAAMLVNLSQQGACVELGYQLAVRQQVRMDIPGLPSRIGHVRWRKGFAHGLVFQQSWKLDEFAAHALHLQPFAKPSESGTDVRYA